MMLYEENINDNLGITVNSEQIQALKDIFPKCFDKDGKLIKDQLDKALQNSKIDFAKESYTLDWLGKSYARLLANEKPLSVISEDKNFNLNKTTENLLIKGDNLEVLKHLKNAYYKSIKLIYIDPPYNTGTDFIYQDKREFTKEKLSQKAGISEEEAQRILDFIDKGSNSHSAWLTFMYPRLYVARQLLKDDGVIFISIDDNEQAQLKMLCDEIFGEDNFVACLPTIMNLKGNNDQFAFSGTHEYTLVYSKSKELAKFYEFQLCEDEIIKWQKDKKGFFKEGSGLLATSDGKFREDRPYMYFPVCIKDQEIFLINKDEYQKIYDRENQIFDDEFIEELIKKYENLGYQVILPIDCNDQKLRWTWGYDGKFAKEKDEILIKKTKNGITLNKKQRPMLGDLPTKKPKSFFYKPSYSSGNGTAEVENLFGEKVFSNPKPLQLLIDFIQISTNNNDIILDFFAGSGTTAHATMTQNLEDGGNRKFILVQLDEKINEVKNKTAYDFCKNELKSDNPTIFDITKERLIRAKNKLVEENQDKDLSEFDLDFKIYEIAKKDKFIEDMEKFDSKASLPLYECDTNAIMTTWKLYDGIKLDKNLEEIKLKEYIAHYDGDNKLYLINPNFTHEDLIALIEKIDSDKTFKPNVIAIYGKHFESAMQNEICHNLNVITNTKSIELKIIIRDI